MMKKKWMLVAAMSCVLGATGWYAACSGIVEQEKTSAVNEEIIRPVPTAMVQDAVLEQVQMFPGTARAQSHVEIAFSLDGLLVELNGQEGKRVSKGELLARIDQRDFYQAVDAAKANFLRAKTELARVEVLQRNKVISQAEYDNVKTTFDVAQAELRIREKALEDTVLIAPFDGVVAKRYVENHEHVKKQSPIMALKDISKIDVAIQVPERIIAHGGTEGFRDILVHFDADGDRWLPGSVKEFRVLSDPITRTYEVAVSAQPPGDINILPGMTATVSITTEVTAKKYTNTQNIQFVPVEAIFSESDGQSYAWVIPDAGGAPQKTKVTLGSLRDGGVEILDSLKTGQRVAISGVHTLRENMKVRPVKEGREGLDG